MGAGFLLQPTGLSVLHELGLAEKVLASAQRIEGLFCETISGRVLLDLKYREKKVVDLVPWAAAFLEQITSMEQLQRASYHDVRMARWHEDGLAVLGDAGHALSPQLGQGVNLALVDASVLARSLAAGGLHQGLADFSRYRRKHLRFYQFATRWTTPFFQSDHLWLGWLRDLGFPLAMKIPWARREMVAVMAGLKDGPFGRFDPA